MVSNIQQLARFKALEKSRESRNLGFLDDLLRREDGAAEKLGLKRIQFETHPDLADHLDNICRTLGVPKREFLEFAVADAITTAEAEFGDLYRQATGRPYVEED